MSAFGGLIFTNKGRNLQAKAQAGAQLNFTRIAVGDGELGGSSIADLNALINQVKTISITKLSVLVDGKAVVGGSFSNQDLLTGFYWRELGLFAQDPDLGEILYCYGNSGVNAEYIPAGGGPDVVEKSIDVVTIVGNAANVTATIEQSLVYYTQEDVLTVDQTQVPATPGNGKILQLFNWLANRIVAITGKLNWWDAPDTTLSAAKTHIDAVAPHSGHETSVGAQAKVDALAGAGNTTTVKALADAQALHEAEDATTATKGHVQLTDSVSSTSTTTAATPNSVKQSYDKANAAIPKSLATVANDFIVASGAGAWVKKTLAETRTLLACLLTTGGTMSGEINCADQLLTRAWIKDYAEVIGTTPATTGTVTFDLTTGNIFNLTPTGAVTIGLTNPPASGRAGSATIRLTNGATVYAKTFAAAIKWANDEIPDLSEASKTYDIVLSTVNGGTAYHGACIGPYSA